MQSAVVRAPLVLLVVAATVLEAVLLFLAWPLGVLTGVAGGILFALVVGLRLQREADSAERSDLFDDESVDASAVDAPRAVAA